MCSISGKFILEKNFQEKDDFFIKSFQEMSHRGPDAEKVLDINEFCSLAHQRLSIIDTKKASNQPMELDGNFISFNGEIYNYKELKSELIKEGINFTTSSDTEVLLAGLVKEGMSFLNKLNGMFAFSFFHKSSQSLYLVRDRFGVKPIYYMIQNGVFYFSSEIKPLLSVKNDPLRRNVDYYQNYIYDTATDYDEKTFIEGISQLKKGCFMKISFSGIKETKWYHGKDFSFDKDIFLNKQKTLDFTEDLITDAIDKRLRSDVPVCLTLSGGIDSTTIYTLIKERLNRKIDLFTFSLPGSPYDETEKVINLVSPYKDKLNLISETDSPDIKQVYDDVKDVEFPIWSISTRAYKKIYQSISNRGYKVILEGHGSDEQLGGYPHMIDSAVYEDIYSFKLISAFKNLLIKRSTETEEVSQKRNTILSFFFFLLRSIRKFKKNMSFNDSLSWTFNYKTLPIVLRAFDRLPMIYSIESRSPFMDYRLVEFFKELPKKYKVSSLGNKSILREILKKYGKSFIYEDKIKLGFASDVDRFFSDDKIRTESIKILKNYHNEFLEEELNQSLKYLTSDNERDSEKDFLMSKLLLLAINDEIFQVQS